MRNFFMVFVFIYIRYKMFIYKNRRRSIRDEF